MHLGNYGQCPWANIWHNIIPTIWLKCKHKNIFFAIQEFIVQKIVDSDWLLPLVSLLSPWVELLMAIFSWNDNRESEAYLWWRSLPSWEPLYLVVLGKSQLVGILKKFVNLAIQASRNTKAEPFTLFVPFPTLLVANFHVAMIILLSRCITILIWFDFDGSNTSHRNEPTFPRCGHNRQIKLSRIGCRNRSITHNRFNFSCFFPPPSCCYSCA